METNNKFRRVSYKEKSEHKCKVCGILLRENLVRKHLLNHNGIPLCYVCHRVHIGKDTRTVAKTGRVINYKDIQNDNIKHYKHA